MTAREVFDQQDGEVKKVTTMRIFRSRPAIYKITNLVTGKIYIGSASDLSRRIIYHRNMLRRGLHTNRHLQNAFTKYGKEAFEYSVVEYVDNLALLREREQFWMDALNVCDPNVGYNIVPDSQHKTLSEETRNLLKLRPVRRGWHHSKETRELMSRAASDRQRALGRTPGKKYIPTGLKRGELRGSLNPACRPEVRRKISEALKGHEVSAETIQKLSKKMTGVLCPEKHITCLDERQQIRYDREVIGMTFCELAGIYGMSRVTIANIVKRKYYGDPSNPWDRMKHQLQNFG